MEIGDLVAQARSNAETWRKFYAENGQPFGPSNVDYWEDVAARIDEKA